VFEVELLDVKHDATPSSLPPEPQPPAKKKYGG
jgi:hypothetical protein